MIGAVGGLAAHPIILHAAGLPLFGPSCQEYADHFQAGPAAHRYVALLRLAPSRAPYQAGVPSRLTSSWVATLGRHTAPGRCQSGGLRC